jgi:hypothetical protein
MFSPDLSYADKGSELRNERQKDHPMKKIVLLSALTLLAGPLWAADASPKDEVIAAANKLADQPNYSWRTTTVVPEDAPFKPGPTDGKTEKGGFTFVKMSFGDNETQVAIKGDKAAISNPEGGWRSLAELEQEEGFGRFFATLVRNIRPAAGEATNLVGFAKEIKKDGDTYSSDLTEDGVKQLLTFRRDGAVTNPKGSVKFWLKDGKLTKYELKLKGTVDFGGNTFDNDRTSTTEIKDIGTTKVEVPEDAKKKAS